MPMKDGTSNHEFLCARRKFKKTDVERERESVRVKVRVMTLFFVFFVVLVVVVVLIMIPVTLHCYYNALTLHVWVQFSNEENNYRNFIDYIFFYHI